MTQQKESVIKPKAFYSAAVRFLEMCLGIKNGALKCACHRHKLHYVLHASIY